MVRSKPANEKRVLSQPVFGLVRLNNPVLKSWLNDSAMLSSYIQMPPRRIEKSLVRFTWKAWLNVNLSDWLFLLYLSIFTAGLPSLASRPRINSPLALVPLIVGGAESMRPQKFASPFCSD